MSPHRRVTYSSHPNRAARSAHARAAREFKTYDTSYIQPKRSKKPFVIIALVVVAVLLVLFFAGCMRGCNSATVAKGEEVTITVADGASSRSIGQQLQDSGLIGNSSDFTKSVEKLNAASSLKPGTYVFVGGTSTDDIVSQLVEGPANATVVVPEGKTVAQTAEIVSSATGGRITADAFKACAADAKSYAADYPFVSSAYNNSLEGFLFPKTYEVSSDDTADSVVRMMLDQYRKEVADLDYSYPTSQGLSAYDTLKLASVVERESTDSNRATVASVFYNRLSKNMSLQSDATVAYIVGSDPTPSDLTIASPYNTYLNTGLPAGPICSPGLASIKAACKPETTDYLYFYFVSGDNGSMQYYFSATYEEHLNAIGGTGTVDDGTTAADEGTSAE